MGSSLALACRNSHEETPFWRSPAVWGLIAFEALVFVPAGAILLWFHPHWSLMYMATPAVLPFPAWALALSYPIVALVGYSATWRLVTDGNLWAALGVTVLGLAAAAIMAWAGMEQLLLVGTYEQFQSSKDSLKSLFDSQLLYFLVVVGIVVPCSWLVTLWRLITLDLANQRYSQGQQTRHPAGTQPPKRK